MKYPSRYPLHYVGRHRYRWWYRFVTVVRRPPDAFDNAYRLTFRWEYSMKGWAVLLGLSLISALIVALAVIGIIAVFRWWV